MRKGLLWFILATNAFLLPVIYWAGRPALLHGTPAVDTPGLPVYGQVSTFQLVRENGKGFGSAQMKGGMWVVNFMFTRCPNMCPLMSLKFAAMQNKLSSNTRLASFTVDPDHDDAATLKTYALNYKAMENRWVFLTGENKTIRRVMAELHLSQPDDPNMHSLRFVLLDKMLRVRGYYDSTDNASLAKIGPDTERLKREL